MDIPIALQLILLLVSSARPLAIRSITTVLSAVENAVQSGFETNILTLAAARFVIAMLLLDNDPPRPEQGGQRITREWFFSELVIVFGQHGETNRARALEGTTILGSVTR
ncbi:hypothetical protein K438DRAFT_1760538 [Mycena galopus ATCC 62051]|nr:hypothetical protein K438DRAFT_1780577 [Mycena galopus ATCC 62051]KAF8196389.1 hypothetical protein K438DRAFT_1760538 [Mycena galopus ATCC 62051]